MSRTRKTIAKKFTRRGVDRIASRKTHHWVRDCRFIRYVTPEFAANCTIVR